MKYLIALLYIGLITQFTWAQDDFNYSRQLVKDNIFMLSGAGGNIGVIVGDNGLLIIDDGLQKNQQALAMALKGFGAIPKFVLNTHWHFDHVGGNYLLGEVATIIAHDNVLVRLTNPHISKGLVRMKKPYPPRALPIITYGESIKVRFGDQEAIMYHPSEGHTDGDSIIYIQPANVIHMGDHFFQGAFPFIDLGSGGSVQGYIDNVKEVIDNSDEDVLIIPGHGALSTLSELREFYQMLVETTSIIKGYKQQGMRLKQAQAKGLPTKWRSWGNFFIKEPKWIETVYRDLDS